MNSNKKVIFSAAIQSPVGLNEVISKLKPLLFEKSCILLTGDLASGKTTFVQLFCESYGLKNITSPTFALHHVYENEKITVDHFDLYRLSSSDEIETSGLWDVFSKNKGLIFIEWASRLSVSELPLDWKFFEVDLIKIQDVGLENNRTVTVSSVSSVSLS